MDDDNGNGGNQPGSSGNLHCLTCDHDVWLSVVGTYICFCGPVFPSDNRGPSNAAIDSSASTAAFPLFGVQMDPTNQQRGWSPPPPPPQQQPPRGDYSCLSCNQETTNVLFCNACTIDLISRGRSNATFDSSASTATLPPQWLQMSWSTPSMSWPRGAAPVQNSAPQPPPQFPYQDLRQQQHHLQYPAPTRASTQSLAPSGRSIARPNNPNSGCRRCGGHLFVDGNRIVCFNCKLDYTTEFQDEIALAVAGARPSNTTFDASINRQNRMENIKVRRYERRQHLDPYSGDKRNQMNAPTLLLPDPIGLGNQNFNGIAGRGRGTIASSAGPSSTNPLPNHGRNNYCVLCGVRMGSAEGLLCAQCTQNLFSS